VRVSLAQPSGDSPELVSSSSNTHFYFENGRMGLQKAPNKPITPAVYDSLYTINQSRYAAQRFNKSTNQGLWGIIDDKGQVILPITFRKLTIANPFVIVGLQEKNLISYGICSIDGAILIEPIYESAEVLNNLYIASRQDENIILFNSLGEKIFHIKSDSLSMLSTSHAKYFVNGKAGILNVSNRKAESIKYADIKIIGDEILIRKLPTWNIYRSYDTLTYNFENIIEWDINLIVSTKEKSWIINEENTNLSEAYDSIRQISKSLALVANDNKWGAINNYGKVIIPVKYHKIISDSEFIYARSNAEENNWAIFDGYGFKRAIHKYDSIQFITQGRIGIKRKGKWGFLDRYGKEIISPIYDKVTPFKDDLSVVTFFGEDGIINREGKWVVPPNKLKIISYGNNRLLGEINGQYQVKSFSGDLIYFTGNLLEMNNNGFTETDSTGSFVRNISWSGTFKSADQIFDSKMAGGSGLIIFKANDKFGFKDQQGRIIIANRYEAVRPFHERMAAIKINKKWGFINLDEQLIVQPHYDSVGSFSNSTCIVKQGDLLGIVNSKGNKTIPVNYNKIERLSNGKFKVQKTNKWGILNDNGSVSIPVKYTKFKQVSDNLFIVKKNGKYGTINSAGVSEMPLIYEYIDYNRSGRTLITKVAHKNEWTLLRKVHSESN